MSELDIELSSDIVVRLSRHDELFARAGFSGSGDIDRFISAWARHLASVPYVQHPRACVLVLMAPVGPIQLLEPSSIAGLLADVDSSQSKGELVVAALDGRVVRKLPIPNEVRMSLQGGLWLPEQVANLSAGNAKGVCFLLAAGRSVSVFAAGVQVLHYADAVDRSVESAHELLRRQGWEDGALLERIASDELSDRSRRGIWEDADLVVLKTKPELLIQDILRGYLEARLKGYSLISQEAHVPNEGRVDLLITLANGMNYLVEVKWIGRSLKAGEDLEAARAALKARWRCRHVLVLDDQAAYAGVAQMGFYHKKLRPEKTYLAAYDCRRAGERKTAEAAKDYPAPKDLAAHQYRVVHVPVDARTASVKAR